MKTNVYKNGHLELCCEFRRITSNDITIVDQIISCTNLNSLNKSNYKETLSKPEYKMYGMFDVNGNLLASGAIQLNCKMKIIDLENKEIEIIAGYLGAGYVPEKHRKSGYASIIADYLISLNLTDLYSVAIMSKNENYFVIKDELQSQVRMFENKGFAKIGYVSSKGVYFIAKASELKIKREFVAVQ